MPAKAKKERAKASAAKAAKAAAEKPFFRPFEALKRAAKEKEKEAKEKAAAEKASGAPPASSKKKAAPSPEVVPREFVEPRLSASDADTFAIYMSGVSAFAPKPTRIPATASRIERSETPTVVREDPDAAARQSLRSLVTDAIRFDVTDDGDTLEGRRVDVDPRELRKLRRGQFAVDGKLDLHGLTAVEARRALETFVHKKRGEGDRVVLIVHGKGNHSPRGAGVLRGEIGAWLSQGKGARDVAAFATAAEDEGGSGALLVLLAR